MLKIVNVCVYAIVFTAVCSADQIEEWFENEGEQHDDHVLIDYLEQLRQHPLDLNEVNTDELATLPGISLSRALKIIHYRRQHGNFRCLQELYKIDGIDACVENIVPYLTIRPLPRFSSVEVNGRHRLISKLETPLGYRKGTFVGSKEKLVNRIECRLSPDLQMGWVMEKDPGEKNLNDYSTGYIQMQIKNPKLKLVAGHFSIQKAGGLLFGGPYANFSSSVFSRYPCTRGLYAHLSPCESKGFNGMGLEGKTGVFDFILFYSASKRDASIDGGMVESLPTSGLHRTEYETSIRAAVKNRVMGGDWTVNIDDRASFSLSLLDSDWSPPIAPKAGFQRFQFSGGHNLVFGLAGVYKSDICSVYGQVAKCKSNGMASVFGGMVDEGVMTIYFQYRRFARDFQNSFAGGPGENSTTSNESGVVVGLQFKQTKIGQFELSFNQFYFPWSRYRVPMPSSGYRIKMTFRKKLQHSQLYFRLTAVRKASSSTIHFGGFDDPDSTRDGKLSFRAQIDMKAKTNLKSRTRVEVTSKYTRHSFVAKSGFGLLLYQDFQYSLFPSLQIKGRWSIFDIPEYDLRIYPFENDLPGMMRIICQSGRGTRWYLILTLSLGKKGTVSVKIERTRYDDREVIGSGYNRINGSSCHMLGVQYDWSL